MNRPFRYVLLVVLSLVFSISASAQGKFEYWPGTTYDPRVPTFKQVLGYEPGERITPHAGIVKYLDALAAFAPERMKTFDYAKTWEGRKLFYAAVGSEANIKRIAEVRAGMKRLADPRKTNADEAKKLIADLPVVVWLGYSVHGNEISPADAALMACYHLLAAQNDPVVGDILSKAVVLFDPIQNPDGRDRFIHNFEVAEGLEPDPSQLSAEHNEPWPAGRVNHYLFDMNRDWFALTQPETVGRVAALQEWYPQVFVDQHEMGSDSTFYFAPEADPFNPNIARDQRDNLQIFGKNNAKWFDKFGFDYFTREVYDAFYPGYGASWPSYYGAVAMTYEQASVRGLVVRRSDNTTMHYRDSVRHHFVASISTAEAAARNREKLLTDFYQYRKSAIEEGKSESVKEFILPRVGDTSSVDKLATILHKQGIEIQQATVAFKSGGREYPAGSYVISLGQPAKRLIRTLLDKDTAIDKKFMEEQERRRRKKLSDQIYDVLAWSLPVQYNVEAVASSAVSTGNFVPFTPDRVPAGTVSGPATVAYLVPWGTTASGRFLTAALREGVRVYSTDKEFTQNGRTFPTGTLIIKVKENPADLGETMKRLAGASGAEVVGTDTGWVESGVNFGSNNVVFMRRPTIALAWDDPTSAAAAGATRYVLERQFGYPVTVIRCRQLATADLSRFSVLILPDARGGGYASVLGTGGIQRIKDWVSAGGTLIGLGEAVGFLADARAGFLDVKQESLTKGGEAAKPAPSAGTDGRVPGKLIPTEEEFTKAIQADSEPPDEVPGVLVAARLDPDHWITAGLGKTVNALVQGRAIYTPLKIDKGTNAAVLESTDKLLVGGYLWEENKKQLANKPFVVVQPQGRGVVVGFTGDPNFRAYLDGLNMLFINSIFRGAAHSRPSAGE